VMAMPESPQQPRLPGEFEPHERTIMCWPTRDEIWGTHLRQAQLDYATVAMAIARFEPVAMVAAPADAEIAADLCSTAGNIEIVEIPIDDSWARDSGPIHIIDSRGRAVVDFTFTAWGNKFEPYAHDALLAQRWCEQRNERRIVEEMVLEGAFNRR
jgi:agmatine deiminase